MAHPLHFTMTTRLFILIGCLIGGTLSGQAGDAAPTVTIDFGHSLSTIPPDVFGSNDVEAVKQTPIDDEGYQQRLDQMGITRVRVFISGLLDKIFPTRDAPGNFQFSDCLDRTFSRADRKNMKVLFCFCRAPRWVDMTKDDDRRAYVAQCARLADYLVNTKKYPITHWEFYNEPYAKGLKPDRSYWKLYNELAPALHRITPQCKVGGPAIDYPSLWLIADFLKYCGPQVDFISWHKYPIGNKDVPTAVVMDGTAKFGSDVEKIRALQKQYLPNTPVELVMSEYNINWNWKPHDPREATVTGAVWDASVLKHVIDAGVDMALTWKSKGDGTFGLVSDRNELRPAGQLLAWMNRWFAGNQSVEAASSETPIEALAARGTQSDVLLLINKTESAQLVTVDLRDSGRPGGFSEKLSESHQLAEGQAGDIQVQVSNTPLQSPLKLSLPALSVTFYVLERP